MSFLMQRSRVTLCFNYNALIPLYYFYADETAKIRDKINFLGFGRLSHFAEAFATIKLRHYQRIFGL